MSYILDALKRADSERERGTVPGLHSQSVPLRKAVTDSRAVAKPLILVGAVLALSLLGVLGWRSLGPGLVATRAGMPDVAAGPPPASQIAAAAPAMAVTSATSVIATAPAAADTTSNVAPVPAPVAAPAPSASAITTRPAAPVASPRPVPVSRPVVNVNELAAEVRQTLPKVVISGSTYSDNRALRMLIINGEVFREGERPAPDLQLEQIGSKSAVLNFKGLRYAVAY